MPDDSAAHAALRAQVSANCQAALDRGLCKFSLADTDVILYSNLVRQINEERDCSFNTALGRNPLVQQIPDTRESWHLDREAGLVYELVSLPAWWGPKWLKVILDHKTDLDRAVKITEAGTFNATHQEICDALYAGLTGDQAALDLYLLERELVNDGPAMLGLSVLIPTLAWDPASNTQFMTLNEIRDLVGFDPIQSGAADCLLPRK